jgi:hypothetical protein
MTEGAEAPMTAEETQTEQQPTTETSAPNPIATMAPADVIRALDALPEGSKHLRDFKNSVANHAVETFKKNNLQKLIDAEVSRLYPPLTPEGKKLQELEQRFEAVEREKRETAVQNAVLKELSAKALPAEFAQFVHASDPEQAAEQISTFATMFNAAVNAAVDKRLQAQVQGTGPREGATPPAPALTRDAIRSMTPAEVSAALADGRLAGALGAKN